MSADTMTYGNGSTSAYKPNPSRVVSRAILSSTPWRNNRRKLTTLLNLFHPVPQGRNGLASGVMGDMAEPLVAEVLISLDTGIKGPCWFPGLKRSQLVGVMKSSAWSGVTGSGLRLPPGCSSRRGGSGRSRGCGRWPGRGARFRYALGRRPREGWCRGCGLLALQAGDRIDAFECHLSAAADDALNLQLRHQPLDSAAGHIDALAPKRAGDPAGTLRAARLRVDLLDYSNGMS